MPLPRLREDLRLLPGPSAQDGSPTWSIYDPSRGAYYRIGWRAMEMLSCWRAGCAADVARVVAAETTVDATPEEVLGLAHYLRIHDLLAGDDPATVARLTWRLETGRKGWLHKAVHGYLFFRVPLLRPDRFLSATAGWVEPLYSAAWRRTVVAVGLIGLFLASRQWDAFVGGLSGLASWEGAAELAVSLAVIKTLHEFGHAYTAKRYGCPVPTMGIAFLVMWPVLYTDTTHAYRLTSRRRRLEVAGAGVMVELVIAALATFAWALLPPGSLRDAAQTAAVVSWIGTLAINLNPMMRFDGYYLLADALNIPNLQDRAFALAKWRLREALFGLHAPAPETFTPELRRFMTVYAVATWVYRFFLFLGVAVLVYQMAFKALGIFLMAVEIVYFIALPIWRELAAWWTLHKQVGFNRHFVVTLLGIVGIVGLAVWPLPWPIKAPGVLQPVENAALHAPAPARVETIHVAAGATVAADAPLITLESPELTFEAERVDRRITALEAMIDRESALSDGAERVGVLQEELQSARVLKVGVAALRAQLALTAPFDGRMTDLADPLRPGQWVRPEQVLGRVISSDRSRVVAYIAADDLPRVSLGAAARFIADDPAAAAISLRVETLAPANADVLDVPYLAASRGGPIPTTPIKNGHGAERPTIAVYRAVLTPEQPIPASRHTLTGRVLIDGPPLSLARRAWRAAAAALIRESGF
jgi:putative peptide zinc metalloprotease protein